MYQVKLETFEGPLDLLLNLIEDKKLDITEVSLAKVTDDFLGFIKVLEEVSISNLSDFLDVASKLILIKSKSLIPSLKLTEEEQEDIEELERRLKEYHEFKKISHDLKDLIEQNRQEFPRQTNIKPEIIIFDPPENINYKRLLNIYKEVIDRIPEEKAKHEEAVLQKTISIEEKINQIKSHLEEFESVAFKHFLERAENKVEVIVSFLAILELWKLKLIKVHQEDNFTDILIVRENLGIGLKHG